MKREKKNKIICGTYAGVFLGLLIVAGSSVLCFPQKEYSENENRYLTKLPNISVKGATSGQIQEKLEDAMCDQFVWRDGWLSFATQMQRLTGRSCINQVYWGKDHYFFEKVLDSDISQKKYETNLKMIQACTQQENVKCTVLLVPSPATVLQDKLPNEAVIYDSSSLQELGEQYFSDQWLDVTENLREVSKEEQVYFRTDHHWTLRGAYEAYKAYTEYMGKSVSSYESFAPEAVSRSFLGTIYSKLLPKDVKEDTIYVAKELPDSITVMCDGEKMDGIYQWDKLDTKDKYAVFFGGNYGIVEIKNPEAKSEETLFVLKDSFANCMVPFLMEDYQNIVMIDLRYYTQSVSQLMEQYDNKSMLVLYELSNFAKDDYQSKLLR